MDRVLCLQCIAGLSLFLAGCSSDFRMPLSREQAASYSPKDSSDGFLVGSFVYEGQYPQDANRVSDRQDWQERFEYSFSFECKHDRRIGGNIVPRGIRKSLYCPKPKEPDFLVPNGKGYIFVIPLPAGDYEFNAWWAMYRNTPYIETYFSPKGLSLPFFIEPGKALYVGEMRGTIHFDIVQRHYVNEAMSWDVLDASERDLPLIKQRLPLLDQVEMQKRILCNKVSD